MHPFAMLIFFLAEIIFVMLTYNPVLMAISFVASVVLGFFLIQDKNMLKSVLSSIPLFLMIAIINPIFVHKGVTRLFYLNDNVVTLEAVLFGINIATMITTMYYWCFCYNKCLTNDKIIFLFGSVMPKFTVVLSASFRFVPDMKRNFKQISDAQKAMGVYTKKGFTDKFLSRIRIFNILFVSSLENAMETANSMKARGFSSKKRTSYKMYGWTKLDALFLIVEFLLIVSIAVLFGFGKAKFVYYPQIETVGSDWMSWLLYILFSVFSFLAVVLETKEIVLWKYLKSKI